MHELERCRCPDARLLDGTSTPTRSHSSSFFLRPLSLHADASTSPADATAPSGGVRGRPASAPPLSPRRGSPGGPPWTHYWHSPPHSKPSEHALAPTPVHTRAHVNAFAHRVAALFARTNKQTFAATLSHCSIWHRQTIGAPANTRMSTGREARPPDSHLPCGRSARFRTRLREGAGGCSQEGLFTRLSNRTGRASSWPRRLTRQRVRSLRCGGTSGPHGR